jgi:2-iminobutanoate/2-iminopropanoate deaminase
MKSAERQWQPVVLQDVPPAVGAYSPGVRAGDFVFISGQVPRDPRTGALIGDDVESQTRQVLKNVQAVLEAAGASLSDLVAVTVYLQDIGDWGRFNDVYKEVMPKPYPTRTALGASLHGFMVEISGVAFVGDRR